MQLLLLWRLQQPPQTRALWRFVARAGVTPWGIPWYHALVWSV